MEGVKTDTRFIGGALLVGMAICICGFLAFATNGLYDLFRAELFPEIGFWANAASKCGAIMFGIYLGLCLVGVSGLKRISESFERGRDVSLFGRSYRLY